MVLLLCQVRLLTSREYTLGAWLSAPSIISWPSPPYRISCLPPAHPKDAYIVQQSIHSTTRPSQGSEHIDCSSSCIMAQHSTAQHSTAQHSTAQHSTAIKSTQHVHNVFRRYCAGHKAADSILLYDTILLIRTQIHAVRA